MADEKDTLDKFADALQSAISDTVKKMKEQSTPKKEKEEKEEPAASAPEKVQHVHKLIESNGFLQCEDGECNVRYVKATRAKDLLESLDNIYHKKGHDTFNCPNCVGDLMEIAKKDGHEMKVDKDKKIISIPVSGALIEEIVKKPEKK